MRYLILRTSIPVAGLFLFIIAGCSNGTSPTQSTPQAISGDLFPVVQGHIFVYNEYDVDTGNVKITGTDHRVATVIGPTTIFAGQTGVILLDSVYAPDGSFQSLDTLTSVYKGTDGTIYFTLPPNLFASLGISLPATWLPFFQPSAGVGNEYTIYNLNTTINTIPIQLTLKGIINPKETVNPPAGIYSAYRGELDYNLQTPLFSPNGNYLTMWLAENVGPVKIIWPGIATGENGTARELVSKNF